MKETLVMTRLRTFVFLGSLGTCLLPTAAPVAGLAAQAPPSVGQAPAAPAAPSQQGAPVPQEPGVTPAEVLEALIADSPPPQPSFNSVLRVGEDFTLPAGERAREVIVVMGSVTIDGEVDRDVIVVLGTLRLGPTALIEGDVVAPASEVFVAPGAVVEGGMAVMGGALNAPEAFSPGGESVVIGGGWALSRIQAVVPYATRGLLLGRLIVPELAWMWWFAALVFFIHVGVGLLFARPVQASRRLLTERPFGSALAGLGILLAVGPVCFLLAVTLVGIPVIPVLMIGLMLASLFGKVGLVRWIGGTLVPESEEPGRLEALRSLSIGSAVILVTYMVPVLGFMVWGMGSTVGLGAAALAFFGGLRKESPPVPREEAPPAPAGFSSTAPMGAPMAGPMDAPMAAPAMAETLPTAAPPLPGVGRAAPTDLPRAGLPIRFAAFALDFVLVAMLAIMLEIDDLPPLLTLLFAYHVLFWALKASTAGGIICNLRIVRTDGSPFMLGDALIRGCASVLSIAAAGIGFLWIWIDPEKQSWHDRLAGTYVVQVPRDWPR